MLIIEFSGKYMDFYYEILSTFLHVWKFYNEMLGGKSLEPHCFLRLLPHFFFFLISTAKLFETIVCSSILFSAPLIQFSASKSTEMTLI